MQQALLASAALLGKDPNGRAYSVNTSINENAPTGPAVAKNIETDILSAIKNTVITGESERVGALVEQAIVEGFSAQTITEESLTTAMTGTNYNYIIISRNKQNVSLLFANTELAEYLINYIFSYRITGNFPEFFPGTAQINYDKISRKFLLYCLISSRQIKFCLP